MEDEEKSPATYTAECVRSRHHLYRVRSNRAFWKHSINYDAHYTSHISNSHQPFFFFFLLFGVQVMGVQKCGTPDKKHVPFTDRERVDKCPQSVCSQMVWQTSRFTPGCSQDS